MCRDCEEAWAYAQKLRQWGMGLTAVGYEKDVDRCCGRPK